MKITYIRWSMVVIKMNGLTIVTDPVFHLAPFIWYGPRAYTIDSLLKSKPDLVLVSHRHIDHWDLWTMRRLPKDIPLIVRPHRIAADALRLGYAHVKELSPWPWGPGESTELKGIKVTAVPAVHGGGEVGFVLQGEKTIYFAGDTAFDHRIFADIGQRFELDLAVLPIGGLRVGRLLHQMGPRLAVKAIQLLQPKVVVGAHWGNLPKIPLPFIHMRGTPQKLEQELQKAHVQNVQVCCKKTLQEEEIS